MNKYIIPICDLVDAQVWLCKISARNLTECQEKLMQRYIDKYDGLEDCNYREFIDIMDKKHDLAIGEITDIETL